MDEWVDEIVARYPQRSHWSKVKTAEVANQPAAQPAK